MNYIGIRGHRGAGKKSISYLLGNTISYLLSKDMNNFDESYNDWVSNIMYDESAINNANLPFVYFDAFSDSLKLFVELLVGVPHEYIYDDYYKDHVVINLRNFEYKIYEEIPEDLHLYTKEELYKSLPKESNPVAFTKNIFITLRDFILYFGMEVMQRYFGLNVWVKSLKANEDRFNSLFVGENDYKIYTDVKTPSEVTYILDKGGVIVDIRRPKNKKGSKGFDKLSKDGRIDYTIYVNGDLYSLKGQIFEIAKDIIDKNIEQHD